MVCEASLTNGRGAAVPAYDRWEFERAVRTSALPATARFLALYLASALPTKSNRRKRMKAGEGPRLIERIVTETGLSRRAVFRALNDLEAAGFMSRIAQSGRRGRRATIYRLHLLAKCHPDTLGECHTGTLRQCHTGTPYRVSLTREGCEGEADENPDHRGSGTAHCLAATEADPVPLPTHEPPEEYAA